jgi:cation diffusion facilitator family transporter
MNKKTRTASLSVLSNSVLIILKLGAGIITGSVSVISEAIHSSLDLVAAIIAFFSVRISDTPPDHRHPYGHGKFENVSGVVEAALIFIAAGWIIFEAIKKLVSESPIDSFGIGFVVMMISGIVNIFVSRLLHKTAKETDSVALEADALHLSTDVITSFGVAAGLILIWITGYHIIDPIIAILVALFIIKESWDLFKRAYSPLLDTQLLEDEVVVIEHSIQDFLQEGMSFHQLRTRKSGSHRYIDFHLEIPGDVSVAESHKMCDAIEDDIKQKLNNAEVNIHVEPI